MENVEPLEVTADMEIGRCVVCGRHIDIITSAVPSTIMLWHNGDAVLLTGEARFRVDFYHEGQIAKSYEVTLSYGQLYEIVNYEGTTEFPGDWNITITLIERANTPTPNVMSGLLKNWMRRQYIAEYILAAVPSAVLGGFAGRVSKR